MPGVNIIILTCNRLALTRTCFESLLPTLKEGVSVTVVDNGSTDGSTAYLAELAARHGNLRIFPLKRNMGIAVGVNLGLAARDADYHLKLDNDMEILRPDWLEKLLDIAAGAPEVGLVGYRCCSWHETAPLRLSSGRTMLESPSCGGGCMLIPRATFKRIGFWCEDHGRYGYGDLEYSNRARLAGFVVGYADVPGAVRHLGYERDVDERHEALKLAARTNKGGGETMYLLNKFLFEEGIRELYVARKYRPSHTEGGITFSVDEAYRPILKLHREMLEKVEYTIEGDTVSLDLRRFKAE